MANDMKDCNKDCTCENDISKLIKENEVLKKDNDALIEKNKKLSEEITELNKNSKNLFFIANAANNTIQIMKHQIDNYESILKEK